MQEFPKKYYNLYLFHFNLYWLTSFLLKPCTTKARSEGWKLTGSRSLETEHSIRQRSKPTKWRSQVLFASWQHKIRNANNKMSNAIIIPELFCKRPYLVERQKMTEELWVMTMILWAVSATRVRSQIVTHPGCHKMCCQAFFPPQTSDKTQASGPE